MKKKQVMKILRKEKKLSVKKKFFKKWLLYLPTVENITIIKQNV